MTSTLAHLWWTFRLHTLGVWTMGPLGYYRHRRAFNQAMDAVLDASEARARRAAERHR